MEGTRLAKKAEKNILREEKKHLVWERRQVVDAHKAEKGDHLRRDPEVDRSNPRRTKREKNRRSK